MSAIYELAATTIDGEDKSLGDFRGRVLLVVNVASACGLTPQYEGLQALHEKFEGRGLSVLGFPCNQFGAQEPGSEEEIRGFCTTRYGVRFPMFAKIEVNGEGAHPLYRHLKAQPTAPEGPGEIKWNFGKFLIGRDGEVRGRFSPTVTPTSTELLAALDEALG